MKGSIFVSILAVILSACSGEEECKFCGEWVLISSDGEELIEYNNIMNLSEDGTFEFRDSILSTTGKWATFNQSEKIVFHHRDWLAPRTWTEISLSGDTMFVVAKEKFHQVFVRKTEENAAILEAGLTRIDHFECAPRYTTAFFYYEDGDGRKKQLELLTQCAMDKYITVKDPLKKNEGVYRHFYHYSNTVAIIRFSSRSETKEFRVDRNSFLDSLWDEDSQQLLLQFVTHQGYRDYQEANFFHAGFTDTSGTKKKDMYFFMDEEGHIELYGPYYPPPDLYIFDFDIPQPMDAWGTGEEDEN